MTKKTIAIIATLDSKGREAAFAARRVEACGHTALLIDTGVLGEPATEAEITRAEVAAAGKADIEGLRSGGDRSVAVAAMAEGVALIVADLQQAGRIDGLLGMGGSSGSAIAAAAMQALPIGFPKILVSTMASGNTRPYVGMRDITMMFSVVDISGLNRISRQIIANAVAAVCGMVSVSLPPADDRPIATLTMMGLTTPCADVAAAELDAAGFEVLAFHANGGGRAMEALIDGGYVAAVLDMTPAEWADELFGGKGGAGPRRMDAAGDRGVPLVVSVGGLDMVRFGPRSTVPENYLSRKLHQHNPTITLMRTTPDECRQLGELIASKLNRAKGPARLMLPLRGLSNVDRAAGIFEDEEARGTLFETLRKELEPRIPCIELDMHINDPTFGRALASELIGIWRDSSNPTAQ